MVGTSGGISHLDPTCCTGLGVPRSERHQRAGQELLGGCRHPQMENIRKWTDLQYLDKVKTF